MSSEETLEQQASTARMKKICRVIRVITWIGLAAFILVWLILACLLVLDLIEHGMTGVVLAKIAYLILFGAFVCAVLAIALRAFSDIVAGESPFSLKQVRRLHLLGTIFFLLALCEAVLSALPIVVPFQVELLGQSLGLSIMSGTGSPFVQVNILALMMTAMCHAFSTIFKHGVSLQQLSDDTL
jgi:hypothetical protein